MSIKQTSAIRGLFAGIILLSHLCSYVGGEFWGDFICVRLFGLIGQMMVTPFFFYSGYGIMNSFIHKGERYRRLFFKRRIMKTLLVFDLVVLLSIILNLFFGHTFSFDRYLFCWIGYTGVISEKFNGVWFVFVILALYMFSWASMKLLSTLEMIIDKKTCLLTIAMVTLCSFLLCLFLRNNKGDYWYNTLLVYPFGMLYRVFEDRIVRLLKNITYFVVLTILVVLGLLILKFTQSNWLLYSLGACVFSFGVVMVSSKVKIDNRVLLFLGRIAFSLYIIQRLPMTYLHSIYYEYNEFLYCGVVIAITIIVSGLYTRLIAKIENRMEKHHRAIRSA